MHFTRKNIVGKNMIFSIQNSNAKRQPMNMTNPIHSASARLQFQYSKPNIRQNNHLMSTNMQYSVVKPKGQRLWSPVVHQKLKTRMYCNTVYECNPDYGTCSATTKGLQTYQDCSNTCHITNFYTCDAAKYTCKLDPSAKHDPSGVKSTCETNCFKHYDCCYNTGECFPIGPSGGEKEKVCNAKCATFGCNTDTGVCEQRSGGNQTLEKCNNAPYRCANFKCDTRGSGSCEPAVDGMQTLDECKKPADGKICELHTYSCDPLTGECSAGGGTQTKAACEVSGNAGGLCANFSCDTSTGECSAGVGTLTKAACEVSGNGGGLCANFKCDTRGSGTCKSDVYGTQTLYECQNPAQGEICELHTYICDTQVKGKCISDPDHGQQTKSECETQDPPCELHTYSCNAATGECSAGGGTQTKTECEASGNAGGRCANFDCNAATGECSAGRGTQTKAACEVSGNAGGLCANFSCDTSTGECSAGVGTLTKAACEVSGNGGGLCANFSCDRTTGQCIDGSGTQILAVCSNNCVQQLYKCDIASSELYSDGKLNINTCVKTDESDGVPLAVCASGCYGCWDTGSINKCQGFAFCCNRTTGTTVDGSGVYAPGVCETYIDPVHFYPYKWVCNDPQYPNN